MFRISKGDVSVVNRWDLSVKIIRRGSLIVLGLDPTVIGHEVGKGPNEGRSRRGQDKSREVTDGGGDGKRNLIHLLRVR